MLLPYTGANITCSDYNLFYMSLDTLCWYLVEEFYFYFYFCLFRDTSKVCGSSQARGLIGAVVAVLHQSHGNTGSEPSLQPTSQLTAKSDP